MNIEIINQIAPLVVALFIGLCSVGGSIWVSMYQRKITIDKIKQEISTKIKQEWISEFRNSISEFLSSHEMAKLIFRYHMQGIEYNHEYAVQYKNWQHLYYKIPLMFNTNDENSKKLVKLMHSLNLAASDYKDKTQDIQYENVKNEIIEVARIILNLKWQEIQEMQPKKEKKK